MPPATSVTRRLIPLALFVAALSCSHGNVREGTDGAAGASAVGGTGGGAGTSVGGTGGGGGSVAGGSGGSVAGGSGGSVAGGSGGNAGTSVIGGAGGASGSSGCASCNRGSRLTILGTISNTTLGMVVGPLTAAVTVTQVNSDNIVLASTSSGAEWSWGLKIPYMPADLIKKGDTFDLTVDAYQTPVGKATFLSQTIVLSRNGALVAFTSHLFNLMLPPLDAWGISVTDAGTLCDLPDTNCGRRVHTARIASGAESLTAVPDQVVKIDGLTLSVGFFESTFDGGLGCDFNSLTMMAGFRAPAGAGTGGAGGGATGTGGTSGGPALPVCYVPPGTPAAGGELTGADGQGVAAAVSATVTVSAIDCSRITLTDTASAQQWTWAARIPSLPADRIRVGDQFDLVVDGRKCPYPAETFACQTVVLARAGALVAFTSTSRAHGLGALPALDRWGITVADAGTSCVSDVHDDVHCLGFYLHNARVTVAGTSATVGAYQTTPINGVSFSVGEYSAPYASNCDSTGQTSMAGFGLASP